MHPASSAAVRTGLLAAALLIGACDRAAPPPPAPRPVRAIQVPAELPVARARHAGVIAARHETALGFEVAGRLVRRAGEVGDAVVAGQPLAWLDDTDYRLRVRAARATAAAALAAQADARREAQRLARLRTGGHVSASESDRAQETARGADARLDGARAELALAQRALAHTVLRAPHAGILTARSAEAGEVLAIGAPVYTLARAGEREVVFDLPEHALAALPETLDVRAWADPGAALPARVREVSPQADPASRTYRVRATLGDAGAALPLGASASVTYLPRGSAPALGVPLAALLRTPAGGAAVWVVGTDGRVDRRAVALGPAHGEEAAIVSGLAPGEWVVTAGAHDLHAGERVVPQ